MKIKSCQVKYLIKSIMMLLNYVRIKKNTFACHIRARVCVCVKDEIWVYFQMYDTVECCIIPFKGIFSPIERFKHKNGVVISLCLRKRLRTL